MLGIVRTQPPTGSPYFEPPVVRRMAAMLPSVSTGGGTGTTLGLVYTQPPLPGSVYPTGQQPGVVSMMAAQLPPRWPRQLSGAPSPSGVFAGALAVGLIGAALWMAYLTR